MEQTSNSQCFRAAVPPSSLTVKQVAERLGVSVSTVYRIKRVNGPFLFVPAGRRVLIDIDSFESYLRNKRTEDSAPVPTGVEVTDQQLATEPARPVRKGTGQRELNIPWREPSMVIFMW